MNNYTRLNQFDSLTELTNYLFDTKYNKTTTQTKKYHSPFYDSYKDKNGVFIDIMLPGFSKENISVECHKNIITVYASKNKHSDVEYINKQSIDNYKEIFTISDTMDIDSVTSSFINGILQISIKQKQDNLPKQISIE